MENNTNEESQISINKSIQRSAGYPAKDLKYAIDFSFDLLKHFPNANAIINRDDVAAVLGRSHGAIIRDVASAVHFGLLEREKEGYKISNSIRNLKNSLSERERRSILLEAFCKPKLFGELIEKYDGHSLPRDLKTHLIRFNRIVDKVAEEAAEVFISSAQYANVITNNILSVREEKLKLQNANLEYAEIVTNDVQETNDNPVTIQLEGGVMQNRLINSASVNVEENEFTELKIQLTNKKFAYLKYPISLTAKDVSIIIKQTEVLKELTDE